MRVVVKETDARKPRKARVNDGMVVVMGIPFPGALGCGRFDAMSLLVSECFALASPALAQAYLAFAYLTPLAAAGTAASVFRAATSKGSLIIVPSENSVVLMPV